MAIKVGKDGIPRVVPDEATAPTGRVLSAVIKGEISDGKLFMSRIEALDMINQISAVMMVEHVSRN